VVDPPSVVPVVVPLLELPESLDASTPELVEVSELVELVELVVSTAAVVVGPPPVVEPVAPVLPPVASTAGAPSFEHAAASIHHVVLRSLTMQRAWRTHACDARANGRGPVDRRRRNADPLARAWRWTRSACATLPC
jgi:hypothetical protein